MGLAIFKMKILTTNLQGGLVKTTAQLKFDFIYAHFEKKLN